MWDLAARKGHTAAMAALLAAGADVALQAPGGETALHCAAQGGSVAAVKLLVEAGSDVEACEALPGRATPLILAASGGHA